MVLLEPSIFSSVLADRVALSTAIQYPKLLMLDATLLHTLSHNLLKDSCV